MELPPKSAVDPKKWTRARAPRVRTGCATCKKRHLKCDEAKPFCERCKKDKFACEGYPVVQRRRYFGKNPKSQPEVLQQKAIVLHHEAIVIHPQPHTLSIHISKIPIEIDLLHHVRTCTFRELGMALISKEFWDIHIMPLAHAFDPIKYALCALGGAHKRFKYQGQDDPSTRESRRNLEQVSIQLYNKAIHHVTSIDGAGCPENMEIALTCCVIFICIENVLGRYQEGLRHLKGGADLIAYFRKQSASSDRMRKYSGLFRDIGVIMSGLAVNSALYAGYDTVPQLHLCVLDSAETMDTGASFGSIEAIARELVEIEAEYSVKIHLGSSQAGPAPPLAGNNNHGLSSSVGVSEHEEFPTDACAPKFENWSRRFNEFRNKVCERELSRADRYLLQSLVLEKTIWEAFFELPPTGDTIPREYCERILQAVQVMVDAEDLMSSSTFVLEAHIIPAISMVCASSADEDIQRKSIQMLRSLRIREGVWESKSMADVLEEALANIKMNRLERSQLAWNIPGLARHATSFPSIKDEISRGIISADDFIPEKQPPAHIWGYGENGFTTSPC